MEKTLKFFFSFKITLVLLLMYGVACAIATFIENDFGSPSAKAIIYQTLWFDLLHLLLGLNLLGIIVISKMWQRKHYASLILHLALLMILLGAGITRYFGIEGGMHIREGESSNILVTREEFLKVKLQANQQTKEITIPVVFTPVFQKHFQQTLDFQGKELRIKSLNYIPAKTKNSPSHLEIALSYDNHQSQITLTPNYFSPQAQILDILGVSINLDWGPQEIILPFSLKLQDFVIERYAGSQSPSSYASKVEVQAPNDTFSYVIYMNNVLDYGGYRFFQSSYDNDELGTILSVNQDPGKIPTYLGYAMLCIGFLWILFSKNTRFYQLRTYLKKHSSLLIFLLCLTPVLGAESENQEIIKLIKQIKNNSLEASKQFGGILVQDFDGRIKPMDTLSMDFLHKMTGKNHLFNLNHNQVFLAMMIYPEELRQIKMFPIKSPKLKQILGVSENQNLIAFNDVFFEGGYKLRNYAEDSNQREPSQRTQFDKEILKLDERINVAFYIYSGSALRIFPDLSQQSLQWFSPAQQLPFDNQKIQNIQALLGELFFGFHQGVRDNQWREYQQSIQQIQNIQTQYAQAMIPPKTQINLEIFLNHYDPFNALTSIYLILGILLLCMTFFAIFARKKINALIYWGFYTLLILSALWHTLGLGIRWYVGGHAPWSNAYESMIYVAWSAVIAGIVCFKRSPLALCASSLLAGIILFVAHLGFMDPQIGNLVPVLKSYWLNIHVSIITASYGFLGLCFILGCFSLVLFIFLKKDHQSLQDTLLNLHCLNEISMTIGLAMLSVGNFLGGVWANESWGRYWGWDSKETWALISIVVYTIILHLRFIRSLNQPFVFASASVVGFYSILMTYFGVNYYLSGLHSYASGDSFPIPPFLYVLVFCTFALIIGGSFKRHYVSSKNLFQKE